MRDKVFMNMINQFRNLSEQSKVQCIGICVSVFIALIGFSFTFVTIKGSFENIQKANMIEVTSELPIRFCEFIQNASYAFEADLNRYANDKSDEEIAFYENRYYMYDSKASELIDEINRLVISYGSEDTIEIYGDFLLDNRELTASGSVEEYEEYVDILVKIYNKLPLIYSLIKYDTTGVITKPSEVFYIFMPQFLQYEDSFKKETNKLIQDYNLSSEYEWK